MHFREDIQKDAYNTLSQILNSCCRCFLEFSQTNAEVGDISVPLGLVNDDHLSSSTHRESNGALSEALQPNRKNLLLILKHCKIPNFNVNA